MSGGGIFGEPLSAIEALLEAVLWARNWATERRSTARDFRTNEGCGGRDVGGFFGARFTLTPVSPWHLTGGVYKRKMVFQGVELISLLS